MKTIVTAAAILLFNLTAFSFGRNEKSSAAEVTREVALTTNFNRVSVSQNVKLVLVPGNQKNSVTITGAEDLVNQVSVTYVKNEMRISSKKYLKQGRVVVYVPANDVSYVGLGEGSSVSADGYLNSSKLTVLLNVGCRVDLESLGDIKIIEAAGCEFVYDKYERNKVVRMAQ